MDRNEILTPRVAVLMSTYNGEKFLNEQIDSILAQKGVIVTLFIRDDGSKDKTLTIIKEYLENNTNIFLLNSSENLGPGLSFLTLLKYSYLHSNKFDYFAFADQDDIWLENKICKAIEKIKGSNESMLYCSNQIIYKECNKSILRFSEKQELTLMNVLNKNYVYGCTFVFNELLANEIIKTGFPIKEILYYRMHDTWSLLVAVVCGKVIYDHESYIKYRIHDNNCVGIRKNTLWHRIKRRYFNKIPAKNLRSKTAQELLKRCKFKKQEDQKIVEILANYQNSLFDKKRLLQKVDSICKRSGESKISLFLKILFNIF